MIRIGVTTKGNVTAYLRHMQNRARNLRPVMQQIAQDQLRSVHRNFAARGRRNGQGGAWKRLSPATIAIRDDGPNPTPLVDTGHLKRSITARVVKNVVQVGTNVRYAEKHQQGGRWGSSVRVRETKRVPAHTRRVNGKSVAVRAHKQRWDVRIPARPFLVIHTEDLERARKRMRDHLATPKTLPVTGGTR